MTNSQKRGYSSFAKQKKEFPELNPSRTPHPTCMGCWQIEDCPCSFYVSPCRFKELVSKKG